ncbi:hypothetical protein BKA69DRAFT_615664 [Paraphysoderma sedebokerense]|nr:hypothetical protein BKA69DRAFT_615664 [Paraphysoderma sedebokerense]
MLSATSNAVPQSTYHSSYVAFDLPQLVTAKHQPYLNVYGDQVFVTKSEYEDRLAKVKSTLVSALRSRGVRGIFSFLNTLKKASDVTNSLSLIKFEQVILSQRLPLSRPDIIILFNSYDTRNRNIISIEKFTESLLRTRLSENKFNVLNIFLDKLLQSGSTENVPRPATKSLSTGFHAVSVTSGVRLLNVHHLRMMFNPSGHPDVVAGRSNETEILLEFLDTFDYNYDITKYEFLKYYEIIATVIPDDDEFVGIANGVWNLHLDPYLNSTTAVISTLSRSIFNFHRHNPWITLNHSSKNSILKPR